MDSCEFLQDCPIGGCGILYPKSFANGVTRINCSSKCFCALSINLPSIPNNSMFSLLLVCVYMPSDYNSPEVTATFLETLCHLDGFILSQSFDNIIIAGDFNADFTWKSSNDNHLYISCTITILSVLIVVLTSLTPIEETGPHPYILSLFKHDQQHFVC